MNNKIIECVQQPLSFPNFSVDDIWEWLGDHEVSFLFKNDKKTFYNSKKAFLNFFDIIYYNEGVVFLKPNMNKKICFSDPMGRFCFDERSKNQPIFVFKRFFEQNNKIIGTDCIECETTISEKYFFDRIYKKSGISSIEYF